MKCCLCEREIEAQRHPDTGEIVWDKGNNAEPVVENGRCCDSCNWAVVIPARMERFYVRKINAGSPRQGT